LIESNYTARFHRNVNNVPERFRTENHAEYTKFLAKEIMSEQNLEDFSDVEIAVELHPINAAAADLLKQEFGDEEIFESKAFSGAWIYTIIVSASKGAIGKVLDFFSTHRQSFKDATVKIGKEEISLSGYTMNEVKDFFDSKPVQKALRDLKK